MPRCSLGALANNVGEDKVKLLLTSLCDKLISGKKESQRETASLGLKAVIADLTAPSLAALPFTVPSLVLPKLKQGLQATVHHVALFLFPMLHGIHCMPYGRSAVSKSSEPACTSALSGDKAV